MNEQMQNTVNQIKAQYNPERDMLPNGPDVTWVEMALLEWCEIQQDTIEQLRKELDVVKREQALDQACRPFEGI